jgi:hypothetical protein
MEREYLFLKGMMGVLASFSDLVYKIDIYVLIHSRELHAAKNSNLKSHQSALSDYFCWTCK